MCKTQMDVQGRMRRHRTLVIYFDRWPISIYFGLEEEDPTMVWMVFCEALWPFLSIAKLISLQSGKPLSITK